MNIIVHEIKWHLLRRWNSFQKTLLLDILGEYYKSWCLQVSYEGEKSPLFFIPSLSCLSIASKRIHILHWTQHKSYWFYFKLIQEQWNYKVQHHYVLFPLLCLFVQHNALLLPCYLLSSLMGTILEYWRVSRKKYFTDLQTASIIQLVVTIKGNFSGLLFSEQVEANRNFPVISCRIKPLVY